MFHCLFCVYKYQGSNNAEVTITLFTFKSKVGMHDDDVSKEDSEEDLDDNLNKISVLSQIKDDRNRSVPATAPPKDKTYWHRHRKC